MKRIYLATLLIFGMAGIAVGQTTTTSFTTADPDSVAWNAGTYSIQYQNATPGKPYNTSTGQFITTLYTGTLNSSGALSLTLDDVQYISPANGTWIFTICPDVSGGNSNCATTSIPVTGTSENVSSQINAVLRAPRPGGGVGAYGYADVEFQSIPGNTYVVSPALTAQRCYAGSWAACGGGGGGSLPTATSAGQMPISTAAGTTYTAGTSVPTFSVKNLNNVHYANQWCTTPGTLDDTCISNAVADIVANGPLSTVDSKPMGIIILPVGTYTINNTITLPNTAHITLTGESNSSIAGSVMTVGVTPVLMILDEGTGNVISHITFIGTGTPGTTSAIQAGTSSITADDNHFNWDWFLDLYAGVHVANANGLSLSHDTSDVNSNYFLYTNQATGDVKMTDTIATDIRCYAAQQCITLHGNNTTNFAINQFQGIFDNGPAANPYLLFTNMLQTSVRGQFYNNLGGDVSVSGGSGANINGSQFYNSGTTSVTIASATATQLTNSTFLNSAIHQSSGAVPMINVTSGVQTTIAFNTSTTLSGGTANASYGLAVDAASLGTVTGGNSFQAQVTAPTNILDTNNQSYFQTSGGVVISGTGAPVVANTTALTQNPGSNYFELEGFGTNTSTVPTFYAVGRNSNETTNDIYIGCIYLTGCTFADPVIMSSTLYVAGAVTAPSITPTELLGNAPYSNGTCTTAATLNPANGNYQTITLTAGDTCALTFTQPSSATFSLTLKVIQSSSSSYNGGISGGKWPGGIVPTITQTTGAVDFISCKLDGTNAYCVATQNFE